MKARDPLERVTDIVQFLFLMGYLFVPATIVPHAVWPLTLALAFLLLAAWQAHARRSAVPWLLVGSLWLAMGLLISFAPQLFWIIIPLVPALVLAGLVYGSLTGKFNR